MVSLHTRQLVLMACVTIASGSASLAVAADDTIKVGLSLPLSGSGAVWAEARTGCARKPRRKFGRTVASK